MMREKDHRFIPVLNKTRQIERVDTLNDEIKKKKRKLGVLDGRRVWKTFEALY